MMSIQNRSFPSSILFLWIVVSFITPNLVSKANAQVAVAEAWTTPVNLSNSGSTSDPAIVIDSSGVFHVVWLDKIAGSVYSSQNQGEWTPPAVVKFPFDGFLPRLIAGGDFIHAFWINTERSSRLFYSKALAVDFGTATAWSAPLEISAFVLDFDIDIQLNSHLNLVYLFSPEEGERSAGIYFRRSENDGVSWNEEVPLYTTQYLRSIPKNQANVHIVSTIQGNNEAIYAVWDNRTLKRVFLTKSIDNGATWREPFIVDGPTESAALSDPFNITAFASGTRVLLLWQSNLQSGFTCTQYYQLSKDGGVTWDERQTMLNGFVGCAQDNQLIRAPGDLAISVTTFQDQVYLLAWSGNRWSEPKPQSNLYGFTDPLTNSAVSFRCRQYSIANRTQLVAVGCDESGSQDIWLTSREIGSASEWFPPPTNWRAIQAISEGNPKIDSINSIVDADGKPHFLWVQANETPSGMINNSIYYGQWANDHFSIPIKILETPDGSIGHFSTGYDSTRNRLIVTWNDGASGKIYYSWAENLSASSVFEWFKPAEIPLPQALGSSPDILADTDGTIYIVYSIPINEGRGIYWVTSPDGGATWSEPKQVFNASQPDWQVVDNPLLSQASDNSLHLLWTRRTFLGNETTTSLYYARSIDRGVNWSEPLIVDDSGVEKSWIVGGENQDVFRFWLDREAGNNNLIQQTSHNSGESWDPPQNLTGLGETPAAISVFHDLQNRMQLVQILERSSGGLFLTARKWEADKWTDDDSLNIGPGTIQDVGALAAGVDRQDGLTVVYAIKAADVLTDTMTFDLALTVRQGESAAAVSQIPAQPAVTTVPSTAEASPEVSTPGISTPEVIPLATEATEANLPEPTASPKPTQTSQATPTAIPVLDQTIPEPTLSPLFGVVLGGVLALIVILIFLATKRFRRP